MTEREGSVADKHAGKDPVWKFLISPPLSGRMNMAVDEYLSRQVESGEEGPVFRVYTWERPCLSLGYFQDPDTVVDWRALEEGGADWVRRQTGGRAVLHMEELTYFASAPVDAFPWCGSRESAYKTLCLAVCHALNRLGVPAALQAAPGKAYEKSAVKAPCFLSPARWEVLLHGKKLVGSAQRRKKKSFFQHGSIPLSTRFAEVTRYLKIPGPEKRIQERELLQNATHAQCASGKHFRHLTPHHLAVPFAGAIAEFFQTPFHPDSFGDKDLPASALPPGPAFLPLGQPTSKG